VKKLVLNISDVTYEKLRFEAILFKKSIQDVIIDRIFEKPFAQEVNEAYDEWADEEFKALLREEE
jgi:hypothetical protein